MQCREFREKHVGFVDDTLPAIDMEAMRQHLQTCCRCSRHDTSVRRSLLIARNLPQIEPSPDFMARLNARLRELEQVSGSRYDMPHRYPMPRGSSAALAAGLALMGYLALEAIHRFARPEELRLPPVVATAPESPSSPLNNPAFVAAISTGMSVWPAVLMADQAPQHFANVEFHEAALR
jgi:hypothetical protein